MTQEIDGWNDYGRTLEEFELGQIYFHWPGKTVTEFENQLATLLTVNPSSIHFDNVAAADAGHKAALVNGGLVLMTVHGLTARDLSSAPKAIAHLGFDDVRLTAPTYPGDTLYAASKVTDLRESRSKADRGIVTVKTVGYNQDEVVVIHFVRKILVYREGHVPERPRPVDWDSLDATT
jgi:itaconyl-CoA hydratase